jgi:hypothetical protein
VTFRIGYRVGDGASVETELQHLAIFGLTQRSGKTTALEAFAKRVGITVIVFRTKRGDIGFHEANRLAPYLRDQVDWRYIEGLVSAQLQEKARFYRGDIILACRGAKSIADVHANVRKRLEKAKNPWTQKVLVELNEYLGEVEEAMATRRLAHQFDIPVNRTSALQLVDLEGYPPALQQLVIASMLSAVMEDYHNLIVVLPEARDFIPEDRLTPTKLAVENFIRKGAALGNYLWLDSQSLTGLDMDVMRHVGLWLFGRQTLDLEVSRDLKFLPGRKHAASEVTGLRLGEFLVVEGDTVTKTYVQPAWLPDDRARDIAAGELPVHEADHYKPEPKEEIVDEKERKEYEDHIKRLEDAVADAARKYGEAAKEATTWMNKWREEHDRAEANEADASIGRIHRPGPAPPGGVHYQMTTSPPSGPTERERIDLTVERETPTLTVRTKVVSIEATDGDTKGRMALLFSEGFFDSERPIKDVGPEFVTRGWLNYNPIAKGGASYINVQRAMDQLTEWGFFTRAQDRKGYRAVPEAKDRVRVVRERVTA